MLKFNNGKTLVLKFNNVKILVPSRIKLLFLNSEWKERKINCKVMEPDFFQRFIGTEPEEIGTPWNAGGTLWTSIFFFFFFCPVRVTEHWDRLKILEIFKSCLDMVQVKLLEVTVPEQEVEQDNLQQSPPTSHSPQFWNDPCSDFPGLFACVSRLYFSPPNSSSSASVVLQQSCFPASHSPDLPSHDFVESGHLWVHILGQARPSPCPGCPGAIWLTCWHNEPSWGASNSAWLQGGNSRAVPNNLCHWLISQRNSDSSIPRVCLFRF